MTTIGFDFGTTNSLISVIHGGRVISFNDEHGLPLPSVVCYEGSKTIVGREARNRLAQAGLSVQGNVVRSPKSLLGRESVFVGGVQRSPVDVVRDIVQFVVKHAQESRTVRNLSCDRAIVTIPVNMEGHRRALLRDAFRMANVRIVQFVHEPLAALYAFLRAREDMEAAARRLDRELVLVFDWGGGTLDLTLCQLVDGLLVQISNDGSDDVGGDLFDEVLRNEVERRARSGRNIPEDTGVLEGARTRLMHECEKAKIDLSRRSRVNIFVPSFFVGLDDDAIDLELEREDLELIVANLVEKGVARISRLLEREGLSTASVALCLATGGMANMSVIKARLHELFGPQRVEISERSASLISEGAAWIAHDEARLHLAKNVELTLARSTYVPVLVAGIEMPLEGEVRSARWPLYCVDPSDGYGKFQLVAPHRAGPKVRQNDRRRPLATMVLGVDQRAEPFRERLQLDLTVDDNLILNAVARSLNANHVVTVEVHDLEFALRLPNISRGWLYDEFESGHDPKTSLKAEKGALSIRANISLNTDRKLVPGEVMHRIDPAYFDSRHMPPRIQVEEKMYYMPCSYCGRASNDPACRCLSLPGDLENAGL